jgi:hypothetical protein
VQEYAAEDTGIVLDYRSMKCRTVEGKGGTYAVHHERCSADDFHEEVEATAAEGDLGCDHLGR